MRLTVENTAIVLDSTADFPEGPRRFANMRVVPLYVRFGDESYRDGVDILEGGLGRDRLWGGRGADLEYQDSAPVA